MEWGRIVVPVSGRPRDGARTACASAVAARFSAELRAVLVARDGGDLFGTALVAWDGGEPASRAAPLLRHARRIVITGSPTAEARLKLHDLADYYACRGLSAEVEPLPAGNEVAAQLFAAAADLEAGLLVAGAFGRSRLRELIFGGTTRALLQGQGPSLFLAH